MFLHTASSIHEVNFFNSGSQKKYSDTDAAAAAAAGAAAAAFFILGVVAWGPRAQATPKIWKKQKNKRVANEMTCK